MTDSGDVHRPAGAMRVGLLSESPADEAALHILMERLLGTRIEVVQPSLRARGWPNVLQVLPAILRHLQMQTDADGLVVVVDSDDTPIHDGIHEDPDQFHPLCRMCQLELAIRRTRKAMRLERGREPLLTAVGMAVPAVEGWYLCGRDRQVGEETWARCLEGKACLYSRRDLKQRVYGTMRPTLALETEIAVREARRLAHDTGPLEREFPVGFGALARAATRWRRTKQLTSKQ
ncbi:hypothetical protein ASA1KI_26600 [Opitutales bacterium ASA1]|nr:hypothetical protein ASA1KI_26600 [Opitutales bacterium ASA1]